MNMTEIRDLIRAMDAVYKPESYWTMPATSVGIIQWGVNRPALRKRYRALGYPFGQNDGAFKRWTLTRPYKFWFEFMNTSTQ